MFNNLIESSSHRQELKRRGSFFLVTTLTYALMVALGGIASIYAYDAHLETQSTMLDTVVFIPPDLIRETPPPAPKNTIKETPNSGSKSVMKSTRTELMDSTSNPNNPPKDVSTQAVNVPPARADSEIGRINADPVLPTSTAGENNGIDTRPNIMVSEAPPAPPAQPARPPVPKIIKRSEVINSQAIHLPRPNYPPLAKQIGLQGVVNIQVLIDEKGNVVSAQVVSGHAMLVREARMAALQAKFSPTLIGDQPVKVSGVITYNFLLNR